jgi:hypothetical protein
MRVFCLSDTFKRVYFGISGGKKKQGYKVVVKGPLANWQEDVACQTEEQI